MGDAQQGRCMHARPKPAGEACRVWGVLGWGSAEQVGGACARVGCDDTKVMYPCMMAACTCWSSAGRVNMAVLLFRPPMPCPVNRDRSVRSWWWP